MGRIRRLFVSTSVLATLALIFRSPKTPDVFDDDLAEWEPTSGLLDSSAVAAVPEPLPRRRHLSPHRSTKQHPFSLGENVPSRSSTFSLLGSRHGSSDYCPRGREASRSPTVVLAPLGGGLEEPDDDDRRTVFMEAGQADSGRSSEVGFFPWVTRGNDRLPRFADPRNTDEADLADATPSAGAANRTSSSRSSCERYEVPASPPYPPTSKPMSRFMFGMATTPSRALRSIPIWEDWLLPTAHISTSPLLVLVEPDHETDDAWEVEHRFHQAIATDSHLEATIKPLNADRFERRYFDLVREMWREARVRQEIKEGQEKPLDWFVLADDDTYFLSLESLSRSIEAYDPSEPYIIGGLSENPLQVETFGRMAFGGGSILLSRGLVDLINQPGQFAECEEEFGGLFGGDGMVTSCAGKVMDTPTNRVVTYLSSLHQLDIKGNAMGVFQAGWRFTTLHHWNSWFRLFDPGLSTTVHDDFEAVLLLAKVARAIGVENWNRRYVWGLEEERSEDPVVVVSLGYSVTIYAKDKMDRKRLNEVEHTFWDSDVYGTSRPCMAEAIEKRSYYLVDAQVVPNPKNEYRADVVILRHVNEDGETFDIVWDARSSTATKPSDDDGSALGDIYSRVSNGVGRFRPRPR